jgi:anti-sigma regulatory factor (Ser/Thr protein kinase)
VIAAAGLVPRTVYVPRLAAPGPDSHHARLDLEADPASVAGARRLARGLLACLRWDSERADDAVLVISEIAANATAAAVAPCGDWPAIILTLYANPVELSIMAWDNGPCDGLPDEPRAAADDAESGRGLGITATLTGGEWGWWKTAYCGGKVIWAYLGTPTVPTGTAALPPTENGHQ